MLTKFSRSRVSQSPQNADSLLWHEDRESLKKLAGVGDILPEHYFVFRARLCGTLPAVALMCAVLEDAFHCFHHQFASCTPRAKRLSQEAEEWFFSDEPDSIYSFVSICALLSLDANTIREGLRAHGRSNNRPAKNNISLSHNSRRVA